MSFGKNVSNVQIAIVNADKNARLVNISVLSEIFHYDAAFLPIVGYRAAQAFKSLLAAAPAAALQIYECAPELVLPL